MQAQTGNVATSPPQLLSNIKRYNTPSGGLFRWSWFCKPGAATQLRQQLELHKSRHNGEAWRLWLLRSTAASTLATNMYTGSVAGGIGLCRCCYFTRAYKAL